MKYFSSPLARLGRLSRGRPALAGSVLALAVFWLAACSASGPPVPPVPASQLDRFGLEGVFFFRPGAELYRRNLHGELVLETSYARPEKGHFKLRIVGRKRSGAIRLRSYEGRAYIRPDGLLELYSRTCFEFGKRDWTDRLTPLRSWTCDHLVFQFNTDELAGAGVLRGTASDRTKRANWLGRFDLVRLPHRVRSAFSGQVLGRTASGQVVVWGHEAGKKVRDGTALRLLDGYGRQIGRLRVKSRPGDFLLCDEEGGATRAGRIAYTTQKIKRGGLFD